MKIFSSLLISFIIAGCLYIPTPEHGYSHTEEINKDIVKQLKPGTTTKNSMRRLFARPPSYEYPPDEKTGNKIVCYWWKRKDGYYIGYDIGSTEVEHAFCLEFTPDDKLKRFKHFKSSWFGMTVYNYRTMQPTTIGDQIGDWANEEN